MVMTEGWFIIVVNGHTVGISSKPWTQFPVVFYDEDVTLTD